MQRLGIFFLFFICLSSQVGATLSLNVKVGKMVGSQLHEINKHVSAEYDQEVVINPGNYENKIVFNLKRITDVFVDGKKLQPVQVDMKVVDEMQKIIGKPQTVTSFYNRSAHFLINDIDVSLIFEEN